MEEIIHIYVIYDVLILLWFTSTICQQKHLDNMLQSIDYTLYKAMIVK